MRDFERCELAPSGVAPRSEQSRTAVADNDSRPNRINVVLGLFGPFYTIETTEKVRFQRRELAAWR